MAGYEQYVTGTAHEGHYQVLDGLRGVAAVTVVIFHTLETYTNGNPLV